MLKSKWNRLGLGSKIIALFAGVVCILIIVSGISIFTVYRINQSVDQFTQATREVSTLVEWERTLNDISSYRADHLSTGDISALEQLDGLLSKAEEQRIAFDGLLQDPARRVIMNELVIATEGSNAAFDRQVELRASMAQLQAERLTPLRESITKGIDQAMESERMLGNIGAAFTLAQAKQLMSASYAHLLSFMSTGADAEIMEASKLIEELSGIFHNQHNELKSMVEFDPDFADPEKEANFVKVIAEAVSYRGAIDEIRALHQESASVMKNEVRVSSVAIQNSVDRLITNLQEWERHLSGNLNRMIVSMLSALVSVAVAGVIISLVVSVFLSRWIRRTLQGVSGRLSKAAEETDAASLQIASSSQELASGANQQAASLEETSSSMEEMASMVERNAANALKARELSAAAREAAHKGSKDMEAMSVSMKNILQSSKEISKIIKTIDEIAFQTNILALNAAVEAARAGEAGAGFAVVADEVRNLAQRSAAAARETSERLGAAAEQTDNGARLSQQVGDSLERIVGRVREVDTLVEEIAKSSEEQSQGIKQINSAVLQMDQVTQSNAAGAEETASAAASLREQAGELNTAVVSLLALVNGGTAEEEPSERSVEAEEKHVSGGSGNGSGGSGKGNGSRNGSNGGVQERKGNAGTRIVSNKSEAAAELAVAGKKTDDTDEEDQFKDFFR